MYQVKDIITNERNPLHVAQMRPYVQVSHCDEGAVLEAFTTLTNQGKFQVETSLAVAMTAKSNTDWVL